MLFDEMQKLPCKETECNDSTVCASLKLVNLDVEMLFILKDLDDFGSLRLHTIPARRRDHVSDMVDYTMETLTVC